MHLDEIRKNFLIIGFTGPLRSGCSTAATLLESELQNRIREGKLELSKYQESIENGYKEIKKLKDAEAEDHKVSGARKHLLLDVKFRQILSTLANYEDDSPVYISLTDMLIKTAVELWFENGKSVEPATDNTDQRENCELVIEQIARMGFGDYMDQILGGENGGINDIIRKRKFSEFAPQNGGKKKINTFARYLSDIAELRKKIATGFISKKGIQGREILGRTLQDMGDNTRRCGNPFDFRTHFMGNGGTGCLWKLSEQANNVIKYYRNRYRFWEEEPNYQEFLGPHIFTVESFRNPAEVEYFRYRYYEFYLISTHCNREERKRRDKAMGADKFNLADAEAFSDERDERDTGKGVQAHEVYKQNVREAVFVSDIAIRNEDSKEDFYSKILKFYALIRHPGCFQPTNKELFMHAAYSMSLRSSCISRKVGAVIVGERGYIIGGGWNDVGEGQIGCGHRTAKDIRALDNEHIPIDRRGEKHFRNYLIEKYSTRLDHNFCFREEYGDFLETKKNEEEFQDEPLQARESIADAKSKPQQFCRALHAEENALLQTSKIGGIGVRNGTIYTTTFPCELCAKKIYQVGIRKIVYTEPYPESISEDIFLRDGIRAISIEPFEGVKSHSYYRLYKSTFEKKEYQALEER